jgi:hypothetical protein
LDDLSIGDRGMLKSPITIVLGSLCAFKSFKVCLMKLGGLRYRLIVVISFWCIFPFISMEYPSLSHLIHISLKSSLSEMCCYSFLLSGTIGLVNFLPAFHPKSVFVSVNEMGLL